MRSPTHRYLLPALIATTLAFATGCSASVSIGDSPSEAPTTEAQASSAPSASGQTYSGNGVTFTYPAAFSETSVGEETVSSGSAAWRTALEYKDDALSIITVSQYPDTMNTPITADNIDQAAPVMTDTLTNLLSQGGGSVDSGPTTTTMGGLPALDYMGTTKAPDGSVVQARMVFGFDGTDEYYVYCQYSPTGKAAVLDACTQIVSSFQIT